jgi:hypothetical protein
MLGTLYGNEAVSHFCVFMCFLRFRMKHEDLENDPGSGWLSTAENPKNIFKNL